MLGASLSAKGGISSVAKIYRDAGLFVYWNIRYFPTHEDGNVAVKLATVILSLVKLISMLLTGKVSALHIHTASRISFWRKSIFVFLGLLFKKPVILHLHGGEFIQFYEQECGGVLRGVIRYIFNHSTRVVVLSSQWRKKIAEITNCNNIVAIGNPVLVNNAEGVAITDRQPVLLFLGKLVKSKGIYDLLEVVARIRANYPDVQLVCGGEGDAIAVSQQAKALGISDSVKLVGWVTGNKKQQYLKTAMLYVLPSYNEGLPMGVLEAMSAHLPVVSTNVGGIPDAIHDGIEGFLVEPGDINALEMAITQLLSDPELRGKMGEAGFKKIQSQFSADIVVEKIGELYLEIGLHPNGEECSGLTE